MEDNRIANILEQVARQNNVAVEEVRREIQFAINEAMKTEDPEVKNVWALLSRNGNPPTPEELIALLAVVCVP